MKKVFSVFLVFIICMSILVGSTNESCLEAQLITLNYDEIEDKLIRFHVIANSDSDEDQAVKLKVRDKVIEYISNELKDAKDINEARITLNDNIEEISNIAKSVLEENNFNYEVNTMISRENFPDKVYGNYLFPQGNYEAFRIVIGNGEGHNWWCVMFPPLCFVDETKSDVDSESIEKTLINDNSKNVKENKIEYKLKIVEIIKGISRND